ncbi:MAG: benzoate/H(+) symporter BenE family transporter [Burkholderiaceae bacterium]
MRWLRDFSFSTVTAGFVAVLVGFTSSVALVFQAAQALGADAGQMASWIWALGLGMGLCSAVPSLWLRMPVMVAWSTPGAAVVAAAAVAGQHSMGEAVGAFMVSALLVVVVAWSGWIDALARRIPMSIATALLAGVLTRFALQAFVALESSTVLVLCMLLAYLAGRRSCPRYAVLLTLAVGIAVAACQGQLDWSRVKVELATPVWTAPVFTWQALVGMALPLFVVTMASQNLPGIAVMKATGYNMPVSPLLGATGGVNLLLAPFGAFSLGFSAITAAMCMGEQAHPDPMRRYTAAVACGLFYCVLGVFGGVVAGLLQAFPRELVVAIAGLALLATIASGLAEALRQDVDREPALVTFLVTLSGVELVGVGAPFWGVVAGAFVLFVQQYGKSSASPR